MINRQTGLIILLFIVSLLSWQWMNQDMNNQAAVQDKDLSLPSFTASGLTSYRYNLEGVLQYIFTSDQAMYYESQSITDFKNPKLNTFEHQSAAWQITAKNGQLQKREQLVLRDNIVIQNQSPAINLDKITTSMLTMDLNTHHVTSDQPVTIDSPDYHVQGVGLQADLKEKRYQILEQGHATYFNKPRN